MGSAHFEFDKIIIEIDFCNKKIEKAADKISVSKEVEYNTNNFVDNTNKVIQKVDSTFQIEM